MIDDLKKHKIPIAVTSIGIAIAFIFGIMPLIETKEEKKPKAKQEVVVQTSTKSQTAIQTNSPGIEDRLAAFETQTNSRLGNIDLQLANMNKAIGKLNIRIVKLQKAGGSAPSTDLLADISAQTNFHAGQLINLNKAITRLHSRYIGLNKLTSEQTTQIENFSKVGKKLQSVFELGSE